LKSGVETEVKKRIPKQRVDLTEHFDKVDLGVAAISNWKEFEKKFYEASS
jgi:hypothetical protein